MSNLDAPLFESNLPGFSLLSRGKVRDIYDLGSDLLVVSTDRISAFDCILPTPIPDKGMVLTHMSRFWFEFFKGVVPTHYITCDVTKMGPGFAPHISVLKDRSMLVKKAKVFPIEAVVRGYLTGSGLKEYNAKGSVCGVRLPPGLKNGSRLDTPIFTPTTKALSGHDLPISYDQVCDLISPSHAAQVCALATDLYSRAHAYALERGIIIADTKFEFGLYNGDVTLVDEVLTPDSSRFWPRESWVVGRDQPSYDKQYTRDYLETLSWNKQPPAPALPPAVVAATRQKYLQALHMLTFSRPPSVTP